MLRFSKYEPYQKSRGSSEPRNHLTIPASKKLHHRLTKYPLRNSKKLRETMQVQLIGAFKRQMGMLYPTTWSLKMNGWMMETAKTSRITIWWFYAYLLMLGALIDSVTFCNMFFWVCWGHQWNKPGKFPAAPVTGPMGQNVQRHPKPQKWWLALRKPSAMVIHVINKLKFGGRTHVLQIYPILWRPAHKFIWLLYL